jgi:mono/diheme cytochrome c family protein
MGRRVVRAVGILAAIVVLAVAGLSAYVAQTWDRTYDAPLPEVRISSDPAVLARGEYLIYGPAHCVECHGGSLDALEKLSEGVHVPLSGGLRLPLGPLGAVYSRNLTPDMETGIGRYSDGQIARMMRWAVRPDGRATVNPMMPFGEMAEDDLVAVISFLRAQPPVRRVVPANEWTLMGKVVKSFISIAKPRRSINPPQTAPPQAMTKERGEYLARYVGNCAGCHTPRDPNTFAETGPDFSGGFELEPVSLPGADPAVWFRTPNLTPKAGSALMKFPDRETFIARFQKGGRHHAGSPMPWEAFARMTTEDIGAVYEYLHSLQPCDGPTGEPTFKKAG